jgi:flagellar biosynthesis protein FlhA
MVAGGAMVFLGVLPNTPHFALLFVGALLLAGGFYLLRRMRAQAAEAESEAQAGAGGGGAGGEVTPDNAPNQADFYKDIGNVYQLLTVEPIEMEVGYSLIPLVDEQSGGKLINRIVIFRRQYAQEMGFVIPTVRLHDGSMLGTNQYIIYIKGEEVTRGEILMDYYLALEPSTPVKEIDGIETVEPAYGIPSRWILPENKEMAEIYGYTVIDPLSVMLTHLSETIKRHAYELLGRTETTQLIENLKRTSPELVEETCPAVVSYALLEKVLRNLLMEGVPIRDLGTILETLVDAMNNARPGSFDRERARRAGPHDHAPLLRERAAARGDARRRSGAAHRRLPDKERARHLPCHGAGADPAHHHAAFRQHEEVPGARTVAGAFDQSGHPRLSEPAAGAVLPRLVCALLQRDRGHGTDTVHRQYHHAGRR